MEDGGVLARLPEGRAPTERQVEVQSRAALMGSDKYPTECIGWLEDFLAHPPNRVRIYYDFVVCNKKEIRIPH